MTLHCAYCFVIDAVGYLMPPACSFLSRRPPPLLYASFLTESLNVSPPQSTDDESNCAREITWNFQSVSFHFRSVAQLFTPHILVHPLFPSFLLLLLCSHGLITFYQTQTQSPVSDKRQKQRGGTFPWCTNSYVV